MEQSSSLTNIIPEDRTNQPLDVVSDTATVLSLVEVAVGSTVHALNIPFGGHLLSINQGVFLSRAMKQLRGERGIYRYAIYISNISAVLKSLSPAGNKLGPMVSIATQGFLFSIPFALLGSNIVSVVLGMFLMSLWAFMQPFVTLYLFYGNDMVRAIEFYVEKMRDTVSWAPLSFISALSIVVAVKAILAIGAGSFAYTAGDQAFSRFSGFWMKRIPVLKTEETPKDATMGDRLLLVVKDLTRPFFLFSLLLMGVFFYFLESSWSKTIWLLMRPLAIAFLFFYVSRSPVMGRVSQAMRKSPRFAKFMSAFDMTTAKLRDRYRV